MQKLWLVVTGLAFGFASHAMHPPIVQAETDSPESTPQLIIETDEGEVIEVDAPLILVWPDRIVELMEQGSYEEASQLLRQSIDSFETYEAVKEPLQDFHITYLANILVLLGHVEFKFERYDEAEQAFQQALTIQQERLELEPTEIVVTSLALANVYYLTNQFDEAEPLYQQALTVYEENLGADHLDIANILTLLADIDVKRGFHQKSLPLLERTLAIREEKLGAEHPLTVLARNNLAGLHHLMERNNEIQASD